MRYFLISILIHILAVSFIWVGFSVPEARGQNSLIYLGGLIAPAQESQSNAPSNRQTKGFKEMVYQEPSAAFFTPWLKMRQVDKPR